MGFFFFLFPLVQMTNIATQTNFDEEDTEHTTSGSDAEKPPTLSEQGASIVENGLANGASYNNTLEQRNFMTQPGAVEGYVAMRLASHFTPSPVLQRKVIAHDVM